MWRRRVRREWSFFRAVVAHRGLSFAALFGLLLIGGWSFQVLEPELGHSLPRAMFMTWSLMFGEAPEAFPRSIVLQAMFFLVPLLGVTIFLEAIVEISSMLRDRTKGEEEWCKIMAGSMRGHVVLVGLGRLGWRIYTILTRLGHEVVVIERSADAPFLEDVRRDGSPIFIGDARREQWLVDANVKEARSIVIASDDDLANLEIALDARRLNPKVHVVMRMFDPNMAEKVREGFQIHTALSASSIAAPAFATASIDRSIESCLVIDDEIIVSQRWTVDADSELDGRTVGELAAQRAIGVLERRTKSGERRFFPGPDTKLAPGDELVVQGTLTTLVGRRN
ncbi:MAG: NAD-binding protein [Planctomycetes bacterium]|nr:NAD-binding protein [Planctomycetota bacterium]